MSRKLRLLFYLFLAYSFNVNAQAPVLGPIGASATSGCPPLAVAFNGSATGTGPITYNWNFGGLPPDVSVATGTGQNKAVLFYKPGVYNVTLVASNASGNSNTQSIQITVNAVPAADFTQDKTTGCYPTTIHFTNASTPAASIVSYTWDYGDGTQDFNVLNPSHKYKSAGTFGVTLYVTNNLGCTGSAQIKNVQKAITITGGIVPNFTSALNSTCNLPVTADFTNTTTGLGVMTYSWDYGDGSPKDNTFNASHNYTAAATYDVVLAATSSLGCTDTLSKTVAISASGNLSDFTGAGTVCVNTPINFTNTSSPNPNSSSWDYGDGSPADPVRNGLHTFTTTGTFPVTLVNTFSGCNGTVTKNVTVVGPPTSDFTATNVTACQPPITTNFTDASTGGATTWLWNFGDGTPPSNAKNPTHTYTGYGSYQVILTTSSAGGCTNIVTKNAFVNIVKPAVILTNFPAYGCAPYLFTPTMSTTAVDGVASYSWDLGNGVTFNGPNPPAQSYGPGTYLVRLTITTTGGCTADTTGQIKVGTIKPVAAFNYTPSPTCVNTAVSFNDVSSGTPNQWLWDFGDGSTDNKAATTHAFQKPGTYSIKLTAYNNGCWDSISHSIVVNPPKAFFKYAPTCGQKGTYTFTDSSTVLPGATYQWNFGDGSPVFNGLTPPAHTFPGGQPSYNVSLTVTNGGCTDTYTTSVLASQSTTIAFSVPAPCAKTSLFMTAVSTGNIYSYTFVLGDGNTITGTSASIAYTYMTPGTYQVKVITTDYNGCVDSSVAYPFVVYGPVANFSSPAAVTCGPLTQVFQNLSTGSIVSYSWDFGDGTKSTQVSPTHTYNFAGNFLASLKVVDSKGCSDSLISANVFTVSIPVANFTTSEDSTCPNAPSPIRFNNTSTGGFNPTYTWDFGDGNTSNAISPVSSYTLPGSYTVKLSMIDTYGCPSVYTYPKKVIVDNPVASFTMSGNYSACPPFNVKFTFTGSFAKSYSWDFNTPSGNFAQIPNPSYLYAEPGDYDPFVKITSPGGCIATSPTQHIHIDGPIGLFTYSPLAACNALNVDFLVSSTNVVSFTWNFGDGSPSVQTTVPTISHPYRPGAWTPFVVMEDAQGCKLTKLGMDEIVVDTIANIAFTAVKSLLCDSGTVVFTDISSLGDGTVITNYAWDFDDGTGIHNGSLASISNFYGVVKNYAPTLTITTAGNCTKTTSIPVQVVASPNVAINGLLSQCEPAVLTFTAAELTPDPNQPIAWSWNFGNGQTYNGATPPNVSYPKAGEYVVQLIAKNSKGCSDTTDTSPASHLFIYPIPSVNAGLDTTICLGTPLQLNAFGSATSYTWEAPVNGSALSCFNCINPVADPVPTSTYFVVRGTSPQNCAARDTVQVTVNVPVTVNVSNADSVCVGQGVPLTASGAAIYSWTPAQGLNNPNIANPVATPDASQVGSGNSSIITYQVTGYDSKKCFSDTKTIDITAFNYPVIDMIPNATINVGSSYQISATATTNIISLSWTPSNTLSCSSCLTPMATPTKTTNYLLTATNEGGCATTDSFHLQVICNGANFFVPNTFSPNGDGANDYFIVNGKGLNVIPSITIYNRWGQIVFQKSNFVPNSTAGAWDGTFNGQPAPADVYIYTIQILCDNATLIPYHGNVTLIR